MPIEYIEHGTEQRHCPRCEEEREGEITEQSPPGVVGWFCPVCGHAEEA